MTRWRLVRAPYDPGDFTEGELEIANAFKLASRRDEWLLARSAAKKLAMELGIVSDPREFVVINREPIRDWHVSLSHSGMYAAAAIDRAPVGIDVQVMRDVSENAAHLFLSDDETRAMQQCAIADRLLHFWCAKEAAWKPRSHEYTTLRQLPLQLRAERATGLEFDCVETTRIEDVILAITRPTA